MLAFYERSAARLVHDDPSGRSLAVTSNRGPNLKTNALEMKSTAMWSLVVSKDKKGNVEIGLLGADAASMLDKLAAGHANVLAKLGVAAAEKVGRYVQFVAAPKPGVTFAVDSLTIWLGGKGTNAVRANLYYSKDGTFSTKTSLNSSPLVLLKDSVAYYGFRIPTTVNVGETLFVRIYPWNSGASSNSKYLYTQLAVIKGTTTGTPNGVEPIANSLPTEFQLDQNYPNPFNPSTVIGYELPKSSSVKVTVFDILGNVVQTLVNGHQTAGYHSVTFNALSLASGMYFYRIQADNFNQTRKMILLK